MKECLQGNKTWKLSPVWSRQSLSDRKKQRKKSNNFFQEVKKEEEEKNKKFFHPKYFFSFFLFVPCSLVPSKPSSIAVFPHLRASMIDLVDRVPKDALIATVISSRRNSMSSGSQLLAGCFTDASFKIESSSILHNITSWFRVACVSCSGGVSSFLNIHSKINNIADDLNVSLGLQFGISIFDGRTWN